MTDAHELDRDVQQVDSPAQALASPGAPAAVGRDAPVEATASAPAPSFDVLKHPATPFNYDALVSAYQEGIAQDERDLNGQSLSFFLLFVRGSSSLITERIGCQRRLCGIGRHHDALQGDARPRRLVEKRRVGTYAFRHPPKAVERGRRDRLRIFSHCTP